MVVDYVDPNKEAQNIAFRNQPSPFAESRIHRANFQQNALTLVSPVMSCFVIMLDRLVNLRYIGQN